MWLQNILPLRQRLEDLPVLVTEFLREFNDTARGPAEMATDAMDALLQHDWPGNVRELRNVIERATIMCEDGMIRRDDLSLRSTSRLHVDSTKLEHLERSTIERVLRENNGNKQLAARKLGISPMQLYTRLRRTLYRR